MIPNQTLSPWNLPANYSEDESGVQVSEDGVYSFESFSQADYEDLLERVHNFDLSETASQDHYYTQEIEQLQELLSQVPDDMLSAPLFNESILHITCEKGLYTLVASIVNRGVIDQFMMRDEFYKTPLDYAIDKEHHEVALLLIEHLPNEFLADVHEEMGGTLHRLLDYKNMKLALEVVKKLSGGDLEKLSCSTKPLLHTLILGHFTFDPYFEEIMEEIFKKCSPNLLQVRDKENRSIVQLLALERNIPYVNTLVCKKIEQVMSAAGEAANPLAYLELRNIWGNIHPNYFELQNFFSDPYLVQFVVLFGSTSLLKKLLFCLGQKFNALEMIGRIPSPLMVAVISQKEDTALELMTTTSCSDWTIEASRNNVPYLVTQVRTKGFHRLLTAIRRRNPHL